MGSLYFWCIMTRNAFNKLWQDTVGSNSFQGKAWKLMRDQDNITASQILNRYESMMNTYSLGDCKCTAPPIPEKKLREVYDDHGNLLRYEWIENNEEGNNPMIMSKTCSPSTAAASSVSINVPETPSDEMKQRDYLLTQLKDMTRYEWNDDFWIGRCFSKLREKYSIGAPSIPKTTQEVIDAFKNKRVEIDQKMVDKQTAYFKARDEHSDDYEYESGIESRYYGLKFLDLPVADHKGYEKATQDLRDLVKKTEREIYIFSPEHGLKALMDLEAHTIH